MACRTFVFSLKIFLKRLCSQLSYFLCFAVLSEYQSGLLLLVRYNLFFFLVPPLFVVCAKGSSIIKFFDQVCIFLFVSSAHIHVISTVIYISLLAIYFVLKHRLKVLIIHGQLCLFALFPISLIFCNFGFGCLPQDFVDVPRHSSLSFSKGIYHYDFSSYISQSPCIFW